MKNETAVSHTPGPWYSLPEYSNGGEVHSASGLICDASIGLKERAEYQAAHRAESEANARLIAAAPELLACLRETYHIALHSSQGIAAMKRASSGGRLTQWQSDTLRTFAATEAAITKATA